MEARALTVVTPRTFRSGETPSLKVTTRNLEKLTFTAYKLNPEAYFRKKHGLENVESLDIGLVAPDAEWTVAVPGYARYKPVETTYELKKLELPGVYVVKVTDEKHLQATTLVLGSDLDAIVKTSRDQVLVFAQDMKTGKGRPGRGCWSPTPGQVVLEAKTGADGVLLHDWRRRAKPNRRLTYLVLDGGPRRRLGPGRARQGVAGADRPRLPLHRPAGLPARPAGRRPRRGPRGPERPVCQRPQGRLSVRGHRQPRPADRRPAA